MIYTLIQKALTSSGFQVHLFFLIMLGFQLLQSNNEEAKYELPYALVPSIVTNFHLQCISCSINWQSFYKSVKLSGAEPNKIALPTLKPMY
jgi:hypothetical protein